MELEINLITKMDVHQEKLSMGKKQIELFKKYKPLMKQLVIKDIKLKYRRSFLGYIWSPKSINDHDYYGNCVSADVPV